MTGWRPTVQCGRGFGGRAVHGFDLTFCAPKSVSLIRAVRGDDVAEKAIADAHTTAMSEAMEYLAAHAGYTRVHNPVTRRKGPCSAAGCGGDRLPARDEPRAGIRTCTPT